MTCPPMPCVWTNSSRSWCEHLAGLLFVGLMLLGGPTDRADDGCCGQGLTLLERMMASYLGEGVVTAVNRARKLINLPLIARSC